MQVPEGPYFVYDAAPTLFLGRRGYGPLEVVWDTNVLIDYLTYGSAMWEGEELGVSDEDYLAELEGLNLLVNLWMRRDIRFHVLERSVTDAKRALSAEDSRAREKAIDQITAALSLDVWAGLREEAGVGDAARPRSASDHPDVQRALSRVPEGADRELVNEAVRIDAHVFLTRDARVLRCADAMRPHRLLLASPLDVLEELVACGAMDAVMKPETMYWPLPDLQRTSHLIQAVGHT